MLPVNPDDITAIVARLPPHPTRSNVSENWGAYADIAEAMPVLLTMLKTQKGYARDLAALRRYMTRSVAEDIGGTDEAGEILRDLAPEDTAIVLTWCEAMRIDENRGLVEEIDELRATLENERGEGEPPSPEWTWSDATSRWTRVDDTDEEGCPDEKTVTRRKRAWFYYLNGESRPDILSASPTARAAMRAIDLLRMSK